MSAEYAPGTVAVATVRGVKGVRVFLSNSMIGAPTWIAGDDVEGRRYYREDDVTDVRPLVVLDPDPEGMGVDYILRTLRDANVPAMATRCEIADQIEAQLPPPRLPEPGLWGVVEDDQSVQWVHADPTGVAWCPLVGTYERKPWREWHEITNPTLIREGVES